VTPWCWFTEPSDKRTSAGPFDSEQQAAQWAALSFPGEEWVPFQLYRKQAVAEGRAPRVADEQTNDLGRRRTKDLTRIP
jgi:hypothetical protein